MNECIYEKGDRVVVNYRTAKRPEFFIGTVSSIRGGKIFVGFDDNDKKGFPINSREGEGVLSFGIARQFPEAIEEDRLSKFMRKTPVGRKLTKKTTAAKPAATKKTTAAKPAATKKTTAAKPATKPATKKTTAAKPAARKPAARKPAATKKTMAAKPAARKPATKTTAAKTTAKPATEKTLVMAVNTTIMRMLASAAPYKISEEVAEVLTTVKAAIAKVDEKGLTRANAKRLSKTINSEAGYLEGGSAKEAKVVNVLANAAKDLASFK